MTADEVFDAWAPVVSRWSRWAKPVLFAHIGRVPILVSTLTDPPPPLILSCEDVKRIGAADGKTAVVVDLRDEQGTRAGMALAEAGYRPVPLYTAVPVAGRGVSMESENVALEMRRILATIESSTDRLRTLPLAENAPPVFLLDSRRRMAKSLSAGAFDNRSISLPTDFPSANFMLASGIARVVIVIEQGAGVQADLAHTLRRWQQAGLLLFVLRAGENAECEPVRIARPPYFRHIWYGLLATLGLRRNVLGGYGGYLPVPSAG